MAAFHALWKTILRVTGLLAAWSAGRGQANRLSNDEGTAATSSASPLLPFDAREAKSLEEQLYSAAGAGSKLAADEVEYVLGKRVDLLTHLSAYFHQPGQPAQAMAASALALCRLLGEAADDKCMLLEDWLDMSGQNIEVKSVADWAGEISNLPCEPGVVLCPRYSIYELAMVGAADFFSQNQPFPDPVLWSALLTGSHGATVVELSGGRDAVWSMRLAKMAKTLSLPVDKIIVTDFAVQLPLPVVKQAHGPRVELIDADNSRLSSFIGAGRGLPEGEADVVFARNALCDCGDPLITCGGIAKDNPAAVCGFFGSVLSLLKPAGVAVFVHTSPVASGVVSTVQRLRSTQALSATLAPSFARVLYRKPQGSALEQVDEKMHTTLVMFAELGSAELACDALGSLA